MALAATTSGRTVTITISGRFDFSVHQDFRKVYEKSEHMVSQYIINLQETE